MNISVTIKILLALFLAAFVWFVIVSIQAPAPHTSVESDQTLRPELVSRMEDVVLEIENITIRAEFQEVFRDGETHFRNFTMTRHSPTRTVTVTGLLAQSSFEGFEITFLEMEGEVHVESSDGFHIWTESLNYVDTQKRIFSQTPARYSLEGRLEGTCEIFTYYTEMETLDLRGDVVATYTPAGATPAGEQPEEPEEEQTTERGASLERTPTAIRCQRLVFDQLGNSVMLEGPVEIEQSGGTLRCRRLEASLTEDNSQFVSLHAFSARARAAESTEPANPDGADSEAPRSADSGTSEQSSMSLAGRLGGSKSLQADELELGFSTGERNVLSSVVARGAARLVLQPTQAKRDSGEAQVQILIGDAITTRLGPDGIGIEQLLAEGAAPDGLAELHIRPERTDGEGRPAERRAYARRLEAALDPEAQEISQVRMNGRVRLEQGDTLVRGSRATLDGAADQLQISGNPELRDKGKLVTAQSMLVSLDIGDLSADGTVHSTFYPPEGEQEQDGSYVFAIGEEAVETVISAGRLRLDYRNGVLRYYTDVMALQGDSEIRSDELVIYQAETRFIATGDVTAKLVMPRASESGAEEGGTAELTLSAGLLEFDRKHGVLRLLTNVAAAEGDMTITAEQLRYELGNEGQVRRAFARGEVLVTIGPKVITGDVAEYYVAEEVLVVEGRNVTLREGESLQANHNKLTFDIANDTLRFDARADQLLKTRITTN